MHFMLNGNLSLHVCKILVSILLYFFGPHWYSFATFFSRMIVLWKDVWFPLIGYQLVSQSRQWTSVFHVILLKVMEQDTWEEHFLLGRILVQQPSPYLGLLLGHPIWKINRYITQVILVCSSRMVFPITCRLVDFYYIS